MLFGIILSTADTVAVLSAFSQMKINNNIAIMVVGESLVNDAVAINVFNYLNHETLMCKDCPHWEALMYNYLNLTLHVFGDLAIASVIGLAFALFFAVILKLNANKLDFFHKVSLNLIGPYIC